ncbi:hypothetical protein, partial [Pseudomonas aeruginosa]|uniref:hypothetical protein n=1 Tax=Pseudomonas aeruginosa TaxID=287 RepID=UPI00290041AB
HPVFSCSIIEQKQLNTWVSFQSAEQPLLGQFSVSGNTTAPSTTISPCSRWLNFWPPIREAAGGKNLSSPPAASTSIPATVATAMNSYAGKS